jgi:hypothetical protein
MPAAARSRSAFSVTMVGFLPPISAMYGRGYAPFAISLMIVRPTATEPVKVTPPTRESRTSCSPMSAPGPFT